MKFIVLENVFFKEMIELVCGAITPGYSDAGVLFFQCNILPGECCVLKCSSYFLRFAQGNCSHFFQFCALAWGWTQSSVTANTFYDGTMK